MQSKQRKLGVKYLFFWCKNFNLALTLLITFWAIDSPDTVSSSIQYNPGKSLKNVALFKYCYIYVMHCAIWDQSLFGVCMVVRTHTNA